MSGVKQFRINDVVEAVQYCGYNDEEVGEFVDPINEGAFSRMMPKPDVYDWVVRTLHGELLVVPNKLFNSLYTRVYQ